MKCVIHCNLHICTIPHFRLLHSYKMASESLASSSSCSSLAIVPRSYTTASHGLKVHCAECHCTLQQDKSKAKKTLLCSVCSVLSFCLLGIAEFPKPDFFLNPQYLERKLDVHYYDEHDGPKFGTKAYTCTKCAGMMHFTNPFNYCISCIGRMYPLFLRKEDAISVLARLPQLITIEGLQPYFRKRQNLNKSRRILLHNGHIENDPEYSCYDLASSTFARPRGASFSKSHEDIEALKSVQVSRSNEVKGSSEMISDLASIVASYENLKVDAKEMHTQNKPSAHLLEQQLVILRRWLESDGSNLHL